ncbi:hypothetical protein M758_2G071000 [Ceratodon purpureus]|nr:hypothetical protein M758_2G071000 [Ceratodon purpureus]
MDLHTSTSKLMLRAWRRRQKFSSNLKIHPLELRNFQLLHHIYDVHVANPSNYMRHVVDTTEIHPNPW